MQCIDSNIWFYVVKFRNVFQGIMLSPNKYRDVQGIMLSPNKYRDVQGIMLSSNKYRDVQGIMLSPNNIGMFRFTNMAGAYYDIYYRTMRCWGRGGVNIKKEIYST